VLIAQQVAVALALRAEDHGAGGRAVDAQLVLDAGAVHVVELSHRAVVVDAELGHREEADALGPLGRALDAGQHSVDDVGGQVVVAEGDEDLFALDEVVPLGLRDGLGGGGAHVGSGRGLGEAHGAGPGAVVHLLHVGVFLVVIAEGLDEVRRAGGQQGPEVEADVGAEARLVGRQREALGRALAAVLRVLVERRPVVFGEQLVRLVEALGHRDLAVLELAALLVQRAIDRCQHLPGDLVGLVQDHLQVFLVEVLVLFTRQDLVQVQRLEEIELDVSDIRGEIGHCCSLKALGCGPVTYVSQMDPAI